MINTKKLIAMARKWQKVAALGRRRIVSTRTVDGGESETCSASIIARRGHLFVYSIDGERFMIPLGYLASNIFRELFRMSEDEFGLPSNGPIMLPCDAACMGHIISLMRRRVSTDVEMDVLASIANGRCAGSVPPHGSYQHQLILYGF